jgi:hypothetical protein
MSAICLLTLALAQEAPSRDEAARALARAVEFFRTRVAVEGGYVWRVGEDLSLREGEGRCTNRMAWVQPPGTPSVGMAYLEAYRATNERTYLEAARETALALVRGQLRSGGWDYSIDFERRDRAAYRVEPEGRGRFNRSTLDDNTTQSALLLLARVDQALEFKDEKIHEAARFGFEALLKAQYPNGGWPQQFEGPPDPAKFPVVRASYPETWSRTFPREKYGAFYTLNDNLIPDALEPLFEAERIYGGGTFAAAAKRTGDFLVLAQMPDPQPAWAQQYDASMHPAWARKFEPPAITGGESQGAMEALLRIARQTGERKYLDPVPRALDYLRRSLLPDGRLARFYELRTNAPLYFTRDYELTPSDADTPTHYAFKVGSRLEKIAREYESLKSGELRPPEPAARPKLTDKVKEAARRAIADLDAQGRWVTPGRLRTHPDAAVDRVIESAVFVRHVEALCRFLQASGRGP